MRLFGLPTGRKAVLPPGFPLILSRTFSLTCPPRAAF